MRQGFVEESVAAILSGQLVAVPTETVWGVIARFDSEPAVLSIYDRKGRQGTKPVQLLCASVEAALKFVADEDLESAKKLARFWPGPLTLVVRAQNLPHWIAPGGRVGLRVPDYLPLGELLSKLPGQAAAASSLNLSGQEAAKNHEEALRYLGTLVEYVFPGPETTGPETSGKASSVFILENCQVTREGSIKAEEILKALR